MAIQPEVMRNASGRFGSIPKMELQLPTPELVGDGPLSGGLASVHDRLADAAARFVPAKNRGIDAFGRGIAEIERNSVEYDLQGEEAIRRLFAGHQAPPPDPAGGP